EALRHPIDTWMAPAFETIMKETLSDDLQTLKDADQLSLTDNPAARDFLSGTLHIPIPELESAEVTPTRELGEDEKAVYELGREVFHRDAHCATCHQSDGRGV